MNTKYLLIGLLAASATGCTEPSTPPGGKLPSSAPVTVPLPPSPLVPEAPDASRRKAEVGVGKKGQGYGVGPIATPLAAKFRTEQRLVFEVQIPHALQLFKAAEGRAPASHEEFMARIIRENSIRLPELPAGERYLYDPKSEELMVESSP